MANALLMSRAHSGIFKTMDEQLTQLVTAAQQHAHQTEARQLALNRLVELMLRSRKLGRSPLGQPLAGVYREIYQRFRQQLLSEVNQHLSHYNPKQMTVRAWARSLQHQAFRKVLDDAQIKQLAIEAQRHSPGTELRQHALGELVEAIQLSGKLCHPHQANFSPQFYDLVYDEAVNKTLTYVCRKIDLYDPERGDKKFMNWVNFRLERVFIESCREFRDPNVQELPSLSDLEMIVQPREPPSLFTRVREGIEADADNIFKQAHIRNRPDANFQVIALARFSGKTWDEISAHYGIPLPTLSRFFQRCCEKFRPQLKE